MAFDFRYPVPGGTGASSGSNLVTACGTFDPFSGGGTVSIWGKIYPGSSTPTDPTPPSGSSAGSCVTSGTNNTWHFNGCSPPLSGCGTSGNYVMRVWLTSTSVSFFQIRDCPFTSCDATSGDCVPDCPAPAPGLGPPTDFVICEVATRQFLVVPSAGLLQLLDVFGSPGLDPAKLATLLTYDEVRSTFHRAVWVSNVVRGDQLRLEVIPGGCCTRALLARVRVTKQEVFTRERWTTECFDLVNGAEMNAQTPGGQSCEGSVIVRPLHVSQLVAPPLPTEAAPVKKSSRRRGRR